MALSDDIARIAALRGKPVNYFVERAQQRTQAFQIRPEHIASIFAGNPDPRGDMAAFGKLSEGLRAYVSAAPLQLNASAVLFLSKQVGDDRLITTIEAHMRGQLRSWVLRHYGAAHPSARKLNQ